METVTSLGIVNGQSVQIINHDGEVYVSVKPICEILGVNYTTQLEKIQKHPIFASSVIPLRGITGADGKQYTMTVMNIRFVSGWIFSINPNNVKEEVKDKLIRYQLECNNILYDALLNTPRRMNSILAQKVKCVTRLSELDQMEKDLKTKKNECRKLIDKLDKELTENAGMVEIDFPE